MQRNILKHATFLLCFFFLFPSISKAQNIKIGWDLPTEYCSLMVRNMCRVSTGSIPEGTDIISVVQWRERGGGTWNEDEVGIGVTTVGCYVYGGELTAPTYWTMPITTQAAKSDPLETKGVFFK